VREKGFQGKWESTCRLQAIAVLTDKYLTRSGPLQVKSSVSMSSISLCRNTLLAAEHCHYCFNFPILSRQNYFWQRV